MEYTLDLEKLMSTQEFERSSDRELLDCKSTSVPDKQEDRKLVLICLRQVYVLENYTLERKLSVRLVKIIAKNKMNGHTNKY